LVPKKEESGDITYRSWRDAKNARPGEDLTYKLSFSHFLKVKHDTYLQHQQLSFIKQRVCCFVLQNLFSRNRSVTLSAQIFFCCTPA